ncbi:hypothetical protein ACFLUN_00820 [Chloroflexota bacterium]
MNDHYIKFTFGRIIEKLKEWIEKGDLAQKKGNSDIINLFIYPIESSLEWVYRNKGKEINLTEYWNNFSLATHVG